MSRTIWKFEIPVDDRWHEVNMPAPAKIVHAACVGAYGTVWVWAEVTPEGKETDARKLRVFGTGHPIPDEATYVGTAPSAPFIWHVYELTR